MALIFSHRILGGCLLKLAQLQVKCYLRQLASHHGPLTLHRRVLQWPHRFCAGRWLRQMGNA
jgi:hypothetical protein